MIARASNPTLSVTSTYTAGSALSAGTRFITPLPDYNGTVYVSNSYGTGATTIRLSNFTADTGAQLNNNAHPISPTGSATAGVSFLYIDPISGQIFSGVTTAIGTLILGQINTNITSAQTSTATAVAYTTSPSAIGVSNANFYSTNDYLGELKLICFRGAFLVYSVNNALGNQLGPIPIISLSSPQYASSALVVGQFNGVAIHTIRSANVSAAYGNDFYIASISRNTYTGSYGVNSMWTNGPRIYYACGNANATNNQLQYQAGFYQLTNTKAGTTNRLAIKG
jgi:hypothetical protein